MQLGPSFRWGTGYRLTPCLTAYAPARLPACSERVLGPQQDPAAGCFAAHLLEGRKGQVVPVPVIGTVPPGPDHDVLPFEERGLLHDTPVLIEPVEDVEQSGRELDPLTA